MEIVKRDWSKASLQEIEIAVDGLHGSIGMVVVMHAQLLLEIKDHRRYIEMGFENFQEFCREKIPLTMRNIRKCVALARFIVKNELTMEEIESKGVWATIKAIEDRNSPERASTPPTVTYHLKSGQQRLEIKDKNKEPYTPKATTEKRWLPPVPVEMADWDFVDTTLDLVAKVASIRGWRECWGATFMSLLDIGATEIHQHHEPDPDSGEDWWRAALIRDDYKCLYCGSRKWLQVHHSVRRSQGGSNELENLATVCAKCHDEIHVGKGVNDEQTG